MKRTQWCDSRISPTTASTFIDNAAIRLAHLDTASITNLQALSATIGLLRTVSSGARIEISDNLIVGYGSNNIRRFQLKA